MISLLLGCSLCGCLVNGLWLVCCWVVHYVVVLLMDCDWFVAGLFIMWLAC